MRLQDVLVLRQLNDGGEPSFEEIESRLSISHRQLRESLARLALRTPVPNDMHLVEDER